MNRWFVPDRVNLVVILEVIYLIGYDDGESITNCTRKGMKNMKIFDFIPVRV